MEQKTIYELKKLAEHCGCKYGTKDDGLGYEMGQLPHVIASLVWVLQQHQPFENSLDIGIASGGTSRFIRENVEVKKTTLLDDGKRENFAHAITMHPLFNGKATMIKADSCSDFARQRVLESGRYDLIGIDGGHSEPVAYNDWNLSLEIIEKGGFIWIHDIDMPGVKPVWEEAKIAGENILEIHGKYGMGVVKIG